MEWQPIETAPKDGTEFLVFCTDDGHSYICFCNYLAGGYWNPDAEVGGKLNPTHWMPLPKPPVL